MMKLSQIGDNLTVNPREIIAIEPSTLKEGVFNIYLSTGVMVKSTWAYDLILHQLRNPQ